MLVVGVALLSAGTSEARGLLIPDEKILPPLGMLNHKVEVRIEDQVAITRVEQTFRNHTDRQLEATYVFPVPKGASVNKFEMWVDGKVVKGELVEAKKAREIYTSIVRRTQDPGLLEYMGSNLLKLRVFPIPPKGDQKVALSFNAVAKREGKVVEYVYPLKTDGKAIATLEKFSITATVKSQHGVTNVYSPTHALALRRVSAKEVAVSFDKDQGLLDRDFHLFYATGKDDVGLTALMHRPVADSNGYFTLLIAPNLSLGETPARDIVLVLDTSGSMRGIKMEQARKALKYCLANLTARDRFGLIGFATTVNPYEDKLLPASADQLKRAHKWVDDLEATGGTAINDALEAALKLRPREEERPFTVVFFTDGEPTIGETDPEKILRNVATKNTANTRIFTFGVGDDVNAALLDRLAENTRALSAYVRPAEDIEAKVSGLFSKIANPVLSNLTLSTTGSVRLREVYPAQLPDLFHGGQLVVMGRYTGKGASAIKLSGKLGKTTKEFVYETTFPAKTGDSHEFVEHLWARRKVGYLLDQIRINGERKELVDEVTALAKRYGITTPYTSYLIVPDTVTPVVRGSGFGGGGGGGGRGRPGMAPVPRGLAPAKGAPGGPRPVEDFARSSGDLGKARGKLADDEADVLAESSKGPKSGKKGGESKEEKALRDARVKRKTLDRARELLRKNDKEGVSTGKLGVDFALQMDNLRRQERLERSAVRRVNGRNLMEVGGVWIDEGFGAKTKAVTVKALSDAYFRILERHPSVKSVLRLGNHLVWVTPSGTALVIDASNGKTAMSDAEIDRLFVARKK
jgi:Ca-activated chloride channel family protein